MNITPKTLAGSVQLNAKSVPVSVTYGTFPSQESIKVGEDTFQLGSEGTTGFDGHRLVKENATTLADQNVMINTDPGTMAQIAADPAQFAKTFDNADEFKFHPGDNALIMVGDNLTMKMIGNCAHLA